MVPFIALLVPILLSAVAVFIVSSIVHMMLGYHSSDFGALPEEEPVRNALRNVPAGDYVMPFAGSMDVMKSPEYVEKLKAGPIVVMNVQPGRAMSMGRELTLWFVYILVVTIFAAYIAGRALGPGAVFTDAFRFAGTTAFVGYALGAWPGTIWYKWSAKTALKNTIDGFLYALVTGAIFGWLWP